MLDTVVYHCQQAAEKAVKSYLVSEGLAIPKTHDVGKLVELATAKHAEFSHFQQVADAITPLATEFRYPADDEAPMPTAQQAQDALAAARAGTKNTRAAHSASLPAQRGAASQSW